MVSGTGFVENLVDYAAILRGVGKFCGSWTGAQWYLSPWVMTMAHSDSNH